MLPVSIALSHYHKHHISRKAVARRRFEYAQTALERHCAGDDIRDFDIQASRDYAEARREEGVSDSTIRRELGVLMAAAHHCRKWKLINPTEMPVIELTAEGEARKIWLFKEELAKLLNTAGSMDRRVFRFVQLAYHTASRKTAIEQLPWDRVDLLLRRIDLQDPQSPRTKKHRPIVPISENMAAELTIMKSKATTRFVLGTDNDIRPAFDRVAIAAGLAILSKSGSRQEGRLTPHVLRHTRATHLLQDGKSPWAVANLLGDNLTTVLRVYGHACPDYMAEVLQP